MNRMFPTGNTSSFTTFICESFQKRCEYRCLENWKRLCSSTHTLPFCSIGDETDAAVSSPYVFDNDCLRQTSLYLLTHRLAIYVAPFDNALRAHPHVFVVSTKVPFMSLQHTYKMGVEDVEGDNGSGGTESAWITISPIGNCAVPIKV